MALDPSSLKVTELRAELSSRSLPTKGKKDELIARLKEALEKDQSIEEATTKENPATTEELKETSDKEIAQVQESQIKEDSTEEITVKPVDTIVEKSTEVVNEKSEVEVVEKPLEISEKSKEEVDKLPSTEVIGKPKEKVNEVPNNNEDKNQEKPKEQSVETPQVQSIEKSEEIIEKSKEFEKNSPIEDMNTDRTTTKRKLSVDNVDGSEEKRTKVDTAAIGCCALYVKGFVRPLISRNVQELFGKYGKVKRFWMDFIKTHSYVIYESEEEASEAFNNINGIVFPQDTGKTLTAGKLTSEQAEQLIDYEQAAASNHIRIEWEPLVEKVKSGESLPQSPGGGGSSARVARSIGMGQIAKQLAQAAEPSSNPSRQITITAPVAVPKELSLDDLFRKTETLPHLYYLPVSDEEASIKLKSIQNL